MSELRLNPITREWVIIAREKGKKPEGRARCLFKNSGPASGTAIEHPHSQVVGVPVTPLHIRSRIENAIDSSMIRGSV